LRTVGSLLLAVVGAYAFGVAASVVVEAKPDEPWFLLAGAFLLIAGFAFFLALAIRGATWAIALPCGIATVPAAFSALGGEPHGWIVTASMLGLAFVMVGLGRLRTEALITR